MPKPVMHEHHWCGWMLVNCRTVADERQRNHHQINVVRRRAVEEAVNELNVVAHKSASRTKVFRAGIDYRQSGVRQKPLQNQRGARKHSSAHDPHAAYALEVWQQCSKSAFVLSEHEPLQRCRAQTQPPNTVEVE